jgi:hypothetical protein
MVGAKTLIKMKAKGSHSLFLGSQTYLTFWSVCGRCGLL